MQDEEKIKLRGIPVYIFCLFMQNSLHNGLVLIATGTLVVVSYLFKFFLCKLAIFRPDKIINRKVASSSLLFKFGSLWPNVTVHKHQISPS